MQLVSIDSIGCPLYKQFNNPIYNFLHNTQTMNQYTSNIKN